MPITRDQFNELGKIEIASWAVCKDLLLEDCCREEEK